MTTFYKVNMPSLAFIIEDDPPENPEEYFLECISMWLEITSPEDIRGLIEVEEE